MTPILGSRTMEGDDTGRKRLSMPCVNIYHHLALSKQGWKHALRFTTALQTQGLTTSRMALALDRCSAPYWSQLAGHGESERVVSGRRSDRETTQSNTEVHGIVFAAATQNVAQRSWHDCPYKPSTAFFQGPASELLSELSWSSYRCVSTL